MHAGSWRASSRRASRQHLGPGVTQREGADARPYSVCVTSPNRNSPGLSARRGSSRTCISRLELSCRTSLPKKVSGDDRHRRSDSKCRGSNPPAPTGQSVSNARKLYGFNHPYFPKGDPRAELLIAWARAIEPMPKPAKQALWFLEEAREQCGAYPGMAVGLVVLCMALGLPRRSAIALWSVSHAAGQIAHVLEQRMQGFVMRPRAKYAGRSSGST
jgi:Citrate synthase, C-terminal domain